MLNHYFKINDKVNLNSSVMYQFGKVANSNIDYQNANSPDPTYYRKMPSFTAHFMRQIMENFREHLPQILKMQPKVKKPFSQSTNRLDCDLSSQSNPILIEWNNYGL
jgi:methyltransferase-like protein